MANRRVIKSSAHLEMIPKPFDGLRVPSIEVRFHHNRVLERFLSV